MAMLGSNAGGHIQTQLTRSLEKILEEANQSGELKLSNRKLKDFPKSNDKYNLNDTVIADLSKNRFAELPQEVTTFHFLEKLQCYHNTIRYIPYTIVNLQCLIFLDLSRNQLNVLPREVCQLPIKILLLSNNNLTHLPDELHRMSQLTELDVSCNQLTHLPPRLGDLKNLQSLILRNNLLLAVPIEITFLKLTRLDLRANRIGSLPIEIRDVDTLIDLLVDDNPLTNPPASLCRRGRVHIFKYLEDEAVKLDRKCGGANGGTLSRRSRKSNKCSSPGPTNLPDRLKHKRQNVDSGYSTSSDGFDKRWSQELSGESEKTWGSTPVLGRGDVNGTHSILSTPSTISPAPDLDPDEDYDRQASFRLSPGAGDGSTPNLSNGNEADDKSKPLHQIQTYREYKEALKQQRAQDVPSVYRTKDSDEQSYKTEPNTPTHHPSTHHSSLATSKSDPTPLNSLLSGGKYVFDDTNNVPKKIDRTSPFKNVSGYSPTHALHNGNYVKPKSPIVGKMGILSHDNVPISCHTNANGLGGKPISPKSSPLPAGYVNGGTLNGVKANRNITWNKDVPPDKMTFTMRREIDKAREESDLINQLRNIIESRLKMTLPKELAPSLTDGVVLCHLANHIKPRSVASIHVPSPAVPKLTMARCRRNVDNFIDACRKIGVDENLVCCASDVLEGRGLVQVAVTVTELLRFHSPKSPLHTNSISTVV